MPRDCFIPHHRDWIKLLSDGPLLCLSGVGIKISPREPPWLSLESCRDDSFGPSLTKTSAEGLRYHCSF